MISKKKDLPFSTKSPIPTVLIVIGILFLVSLMFSGCVSLIFSAGSEDVYGRNVALIRIDSPIMLGEIDSPFVSQPSSQDIIDHIAKADFNPEIKAIIFEINSPGGSALASAELVEAIKGVNKTTVAWVREISASGAYWATSATDYVVAHDLSIVGSIGVISSYIDFHQFMDDKNITYNRLVAGKYKDMGTPFKELTSEEKDLMQKRLDIIYDYFVEDVAVNRNMSEEKVKELATGEIYLGLEAIQLGLVDELGGYSEVISYLETDMNQTASVIVYKKKKGFFDSLSDVSTDFSYSLGKGIGDNIFKVEKEPLISLQ